ncbi:MAG: glycoside hydrolase family 31 protein, partial [Planctomycetota bacterium]|nr:glycoside hydrolase family 31 protein [Planctomycetota bacterium]
MTPDDPRPHLAVSVPRLADLPLDEIDATVARTRTTGEVVYAASIETWTPSIAGWTPGESLVLPFPLTHEALEADAPRVRFEWDGRTLRAQVAWAQGTDAFGLGEQVGGLRRNGRSYLLWNSDAWCYGEQTPALYQSHPFVLALKPDGGALGIIVDSPARATALVADDGVEFAVEGEPCVVHLIDADAPAEVLKALAAMIGTAARPPRWALGYHQCRWSYENESEVREVATRLRAERVPCDAIWFDIDYMDRWRVFTWNEERFGDPRGLIEELEDQGFHSVAIVDPGIAVAGDNPACVSGLAGRHFLEDASGQPVQGRVWPGVCHFPDFTRGSTRAWWASLVKELVEESGLHGLWNDMNEPSVFRTPARTLPDDTRHRGLGGGDHVKFHNLYGQLMCEATLAGVRAARPDARPFVLTRAAHLASGRLAATWTGDNMSRWEDLRWAVPMVLSLGLSGQPFSGPDLGGFYGDPDEELFVRWFEVGALLPFCRGHSEKTSCRKEPWSFGKAPLAHVRANLERRMRLLPVFVTLFEEAHRTGLPICRPLWMLDPELRAIDDAFALGTDLIAAPVLEPGVTSREVPLPASAGSWFVHAGDGTRLEGASARIDAPLGTCPLLARGGSVIVEGATRLHTGEPDTERLWHVYLDGNGRAEGHVVEDLGEGSDGPMLERRILVEVRGARLSVDLLDQGSLA